MNNPIDEGTLLSYLYGTLDAPTRLKVELYLKEHPEVAEELAGLKELRQFMGSIPEPELPEMPNLELPRQRSFSRYWVGVAASILLILGFFWIGTRVEIYEQGMSIHMGHTPDQTFDYEQLRADLMAEWQAGQEQIAAQQEEQMSELVLRVREMEKRPSIEQPALRQMIDRHYQQQLPKLVQALTDIQEEQSVEYRQLMAEVWDLLQQQRESDRQAIAAELVQLQSGIDYYQQETARAFETLLTSNYSSE